MTPATATSRSLGAELHQEAPFHGPEEEAFLSLQRTADQLRRELTDLLKHHHLTPQQYNVLRILRGAGAEGRLTGEIGDRLVVQDPDVPRLLDRMEKREWITRQRQTDDRRCVRVTLTRAGKKLVDSLDAPVQALHVAQWATLGKTKVRALLESLASVRHR